jgi:hypothetical protein
MINNATRTNPSRLDDLSGEDTEIDHSQRDSDGDDRINREELKTTNEKDEGPKEELILQKKRIAKRKFTEEMLIGPCGIKRVYDTFPKKCRFRGKGYEVCTRTSVTHVCTHKVCRFLI